MEEELAVRDARKQRPRAVHLRRDGQLEPQLDQRAHSGHVAGAQPGHAQQRGQVAAVAAQESRGAGPPQRRVRQLGLNKLVFFLND